MWGWGRNYKDDDGNPSTSTGNSGKGTGMGAFVLSSPRSPVSLAGTTASKKNSSFHGNKNYLSNAEHSKHRRRSWGGKDRQSVRNNGATVTGTILHGSSGNGSEFHMGGVTVLEKGSSTMHLAETYSGIEVSLSQDKSLQFGAKGANHGHSLSNSLSMVSTLQSDSLQKPMHAKSPNHAGVISLQPQLVERQKIYRAQFQSTNYNSSAISSSSGNTHRHQGAPSPYCKPVIDPTSLFGKPREHRLPLFDYKIAMSSYDDVLDLLKGYSVKDEIQCLTDELEQTDNELKAIEKDRSDIERLNLTNSVENIQNSASKKVNMIESRDEQLARGGFGTREIPSTIGNTLNNSATSPEPEWDINRILSTRKNLTANEIVQLQTERGTCLTVSIENSRAFESLLAQCGGKGTTCIPFQVYDTKQRIASYNYHGPNVVTLRPGNNSIFESYADSTSAACNIQQIALLRFSSSNQLSDSSFFLSRDSGGSFYYGRLPDKMYRRMKSNSASTATSNERASGYSRVAISEPQRQPYDPRDIQYLSSGPFGSYYCEFRNGECWWGFTSYDEELDAICNEWDVHIIAFGPCLSLEVGNGNAISPNPSSGHSFKATSWIVIARDGRAAWKNLPARLHNKLASRLANETFPVDVSLGSGGSYFIRFLDGTTDWQLPSRTAAICQRLENDGSRITSIILHPELSHDFIIRHR